MILQPETRVTVVEHTDADRRPRPGGKLYGGSVLFATRLYTVISYDDASLTRTGADLFLTGTGWRAFEAEYRWRLRGPAGWPRPDDLP
jgi:hypothetical protein